MREYIIILTSILRLILIHAYYRYIRENPLGGNLTAFLKAVKWSKSGILTAAAKCKKYAPRLFVNPVKRAGDRKRALKANIKKLL